jgi:hypothetical protein
MIETALAQMLQLSRQDAKRAKKNQLYSGIDQKPFLSGGLPGKIKSVQALASFAILA